MSIKILRDLENDNCFGTEAKLETGNIAQAR